MDFGHVDVNLAKGVHIDRQTVKIKHNQQDLEKYILQFTYDAYVPGRVAIHFFSKLGDDQTKQDLIPSITFDVQKGFDQKFRQETGSGIDISLYKANGREYMLAIQAVGSGTTAYQYTEAKFDKEEGEWQVRVTYQSLQLNGVKYVLYDISNFHMDGN